MNHGSSSTQGPGLDFRDIVYILFRHKWKIIILSLAGVAAAGALYRYGPVPYQSEAKLFVKYVVDKTAPIQETENEARSRMSSDRTGENVINTEVEILTSLDLAVQAATNLPPEIAAKLSGGKGAYRTAGAILQGLVPQVSKQSDVIRLIFKNRDAQVVQPVLIAVVEAYKIKHYKVHGDPGQYDEYLATQAAASKAQLTNTERDLLKEKKEIGFNSLQDDRKIYSDQIAAHEKEAMDTRAELAGLEAEVGRMTSLLLSNTPPAAPSPTGSNAVSAATAVGGTTLGAAAAPRPVTADTERDYRAVCEVLDGLRKKELETSVGLTAESSAVKILREQIAAKEREKRKLEAENPRLLWTAVSVGKPDGATGPGSGRDLGAQASLDAAEVRISGLKAKLHEVTDQLALLRARAAKLDDAAGLIMEIERQRSLEATQAYYYEWTAEKMKADELVYQSRNVNIKTIDSPSPPFRDRSKLMKAVVAVLVGSIGLAFGLAFALEFYLDPSIKRPVEIESRLRLPLFLSVPRLHLNGTAGRRALNGGQRRLLADQTEEGGGKEATEGRVERRLVRKERASEELQGFHDALRDRLIMYFELKNLTHKPKLVAVTSCGEGSGVTTTATGLAASLSEMGDGKVLLVDMSNDGAEHPLLAGKVACGLEDALELGRRDSALVREKLYMVREFRSGENVPRSRPRDFQSLAPRLKASDYDYIIFDMPPVSQVSTTAKLARYMDIALVVVEAEETDREVVKRAGAFLTQTGANVGVVLNKTRSYGPKRLQPEL